MDTSAVTKGIIRSGVSVITGALVLTSMNMLTNSLKQSGNENTDNIVLGVAATGMLAGAYASTMPSVADNEYASAAVNGATNAFGLVTMHKVVNMGSGVVQKDATGAPKLDPVTNQPVITEQRVYYGLGNASIPSMSDFGMQSPNVTDTETPDEYGGVAGVYNSAVTAGI